MDGYCRNENEAGAAANNSADSSTSYPHSTLPSSWHSEHNFNLSCFYPDSVQQPSEDVAVNLFQQQTLDPEMAIDFYGYCDNDYLQPFEDAQTLDGSFEDFELPETPAEPLGHTDELLEGLNHQFCPDEDDQLVFRFSDKMFSLSSGVSPLTCTRAPATQVFETPPTTPKENQSLDKKESQQLFTFDPPTRRARLGGISVADMETDIELVDGQVDDGVFSDPEPGFPPNSDVEATSNADRTDLDPRLKDAWNRCQGSKTLEPLLKEELRLKILKKRHDKGEEELELKSDAPPVYEMTAEDHAKRALRRAQNRGAAQRFRQRKKEKEVDIKKKIEEGEKKNSELTNEVARLRREVSRLQHLVNLHRQCCTFSPRNSRPMAATDDPLRIPDVTALCLQMDSIENIDGRPR